MATSFFGKVREYGIITSYTEKVIYFLIEWRPFGPQGMPNRVNICCLYSIEIDLNFNASSTKSYCMIFTPRNIQISHIT